MPFIYRLSCAVLASVMLIGPALASDASAPAGVNASGDSKAPAPPAENGSAKLISEFESCTPGASEITEPVHVISMPPGSPRDYYGEHEGQFGYQSKVIVRIDVDEWGNPRFAHVAAAFPIALSDQAFIDATVNYASALRLRPASANGKAIGVWTSIPLKFFESDVVGPMGRLLRQDTWEQLLDKANSGDRNSIMVSSYIAQMVGKQSGLSDKATLMLLVSSAYQGSDFDRLEIVRRFSRCGKESMVEPWLVTDANAGSSKARLLWAEEVISFGSANLATKAKALLEQVASAADPFMQLWAGGLLATAPSDAVRDPMFALNVATKLNASPDLSKNPDGAALLAAALAANGQFAKAVDSEREAIRRAKRLQWDVTPLQLRLTRYESGQQWRGYLCDCNALSGEEF